MDFKKELKAIEADVAGKEELDEGDVERVINAFVSKKAKDPTDQDLIQYFEDKSYTHIDVPINKDSIHDNEDAFFQSLERALFLQFRKDKQSEHYFKQAKIAKGRLKSSFINKEFTFAEKLTGQKLKQKLVSDYFTGLAEMTWEKSEDEAISMVGNILFIAADLNDQKRRLVALSKCQYALHELSTIDHADLALKLGRYLAKETSRIRYLALATWCHYRNGNILIQKRDLAAAKDEFEKALNIALETDYEYAEAAVCERLGIIYRKLDQYGMATDYCERALSCINKRKIKRLWAWQTQVRSLIGLGNICYHKAKQSRPPKKSDIEKAENHFKQAIELAEQINDVSNARIARADLKVVQKT